MSSQAIATPEVPLEQHARGRLFWAGVISLVALQLWGVWHLCSVQVDRAQARHIGMQVRQLALADCLQHVPRSTLATCMGRIAPESTADATQVAGNAATAGATPVSFNYR